ncbi:MAG: hypothetical protein BJG00_005235 [Limnothrix sp. CACIAM 69d]|nr:MAG: hypothetical protein BJG00_005235 [Limnothrix sp. CACIAM 69d]
MINHHDLRDFSPASTRSPRTVPTPKNEKRSSQGCQHSKQLDRLLDFEVTGWVSQGDRPQRNPAP